MRDGVAREMVMGVGNRNLTKEIEPDSVRILRSHSNKPLRCHAFACLLYSMYIQGQLDHILVRLNRWAWFGLVGFDFGHEGKSVCPDCTWSPLGVPVFVLYFGRDAFLYGCDPLSLKY
jgi:hypothetical protein